MNEIMDHKRLPGGTQWGYQIGQVTKHICLHLGRDFINSLAEYLQKSNHFPSPCEGHQETEDMEDMSLQRDSLVLNCGHSCFADALTAYSQGTFNPYLQAPFHRF